MIWINGPFGVGKSTTATAVAARIPKAIVIDPEKIGYVLQRLTGAKDFRDLASWRIITVTAIKLATLLGRSPVIPMTISDEAQMAWFRRKLDVKVVQLTASRETILRRIHDRGHDTAWGESHLD